MIDKLESFKCTGCAACENVCPIDAIQIKLDNSGFYYPVVNEKCIKCGKCVEVCNNRITHVNSNYAEPITYAAWSKDKDIRFTSTSGGAFSEFATFVLSNGGVVVGAQYNESNLVEHVLIKSVSELEKIRQSKYIQSEVGKVFKVIKRSLAENQVVLFCGTPCQVAGLYSYLGRDYENLITVDFICRGVNSPKAYRAWLDEIEKNESAKVVKVWFKYKENGWKKSPRCTRVDYDNGKSCVYDQQKNLFMEGYLSYDLYMRPSCGRCQFKGVPRYSDITLADFWKLEAKLDDDKGTSMVLLNNKKGEDLFEDIKSKLNYHRKEFRDIYQGNTYFDKSANVSKKSESFLKALDKMSFSEALTKYSKKTLIEKIYYKTKNVLRKLIKR